MLQSWIRIAIIIAILGVVGLAGFTAYVDTHVISYRVEDWSMAPDYNRGDIVFGFRNDHPRPKFGDTVVYITTNSPGQQIGRVAGVPGDHIVVDFGRVFRNEVEVPFFSGRPPGYVLQVAGAGLLLGNQYVFDGAWPLANRWSAPDRIPDDCYLILANDGAERDSHIYGLVPGSVDGPCASPAHPQAQIVMIVMNAWPTGMTRATYLAHQR
jgi:signal peptidase I